MSSLVLSSEFGVSKPTILKILKKHDVTRKRDRCNSLNITESNGYYVVERVCPTCKEIILTKSKDKVIACRNHFIKLKDELKLTHKMIDDVYGTIQHIDMEQSREINEFRSYVDRRFDKMIDTYLLVKETEQESKKLIKG